MDLDQFVQKVPFLYHLTNKDNLQLILDNKSLYSAKKLIEMTKDENLMGIIRARRPESLSVVIDGKTYHIRDQHPISERNLIKCLTNNWACADFYEHLNNRVFMWPSIKRLNSHYERYKGENPVIFRFSTESILSANQHVKFCRLNSGATRSHHKYKGAPPERGENTFMAAENYNLSVGSVAEVTFEERCIIAGKIHVSNTPKGHYSDLHY